MCGLADLRLRLEQFLQWFLEEWTKRNPVARLSTGAHPRANGAAVEKELPMLPAILNATMSPGS